MLSYKNEVGVTDGLFSAYYVINKTLFAHLKTYHQISSHLEMEQVVSLFTSDIPSYNLTGLNVKIPDRPLSR